MRVMYHDSLRILGSDILQVTSLQAVIVRGKEPSRAISDKVEVLVRDTRIIPSEEEGIISPDDRTRMSAAFILTV